MGSGFTHSRIGSGMHWNSRPNNGAVDTYVNSSYRGGFPEDGYESKLMLEHGDYPTAGAQEKFEVIREDLKESFYSPRPQDQRDNSDFKKFTADEDLPSQIMDSRWLQKTMALQQQQQQLASEDANEDRPLEDSPTGLRDRRPIEGKPTLAGAGLFEREDEETRAN